MANENLNQPKREQSDFDLKSFLRKYLRYWYLFALTILLAFAGAKYYNWYTNPTYAVTAKLLVKDENFGKQKFLQQLEVEPRSRNIENDIEILRSHAILAKTLNGLDFDVSYYLIGDVKISEVYIDCPFKVSIDHLEYGAYFKDFRIVLMDSSRFSLEYEIGAETRKFDGVFGGTLNFGMGKITIEKRENFPGTELLQNPEFDKQNYLVRFNTIAANQNKYLSRLSVALARNQSTVLQIYLEDEVPQKGLDFVNQLIDVYLRNDVDIKNKAAAATADFMDAQLDEIAADLQRIETSREQYKVSKGIVDLESESQIVLERVKDLDAQKAINDSRLGKIRQLKKYIIDNQDLRDIAPAALDISDPLLTKLINKLSELQSERQLILNRSTALDPGLVPINAEIELTRSSLLQNIQNIEESLLNTARELDDRIAKFESRISSIPRTERELLEIERQFRIQESLYMFLLERRAELGISLAATESDTRIVDRARVIPGPISPVPQRAYSIALILGLIIPVLIIFLIEKLNDRISEISTIRKLTSIPLLGVVRLSKQKSALVAVDKPRSSIAEEYRSIRTNLRFFHSDADSSVTMITSSVGTEGKTFNAMNLATVMAASGVKVALVGLDLRKPRIVDDFEIENKIGCSNYLSGNASLDEIIQKSDYSKTLSIIPSGPTPPNPSELIISDRMAQLIAELKERFDKIVIDTPPIGLVSDGLILANHVDSILFVVRDGITRKSHLVEANELYEKGQLKNVGIVFNAAKRRSAGYGYSGGYGYGYGYVYGADYGNYFEDENTSWVKRWFKRSKE